MPPRGSQINLYPKDLLEVSAAPVDAHHWWAVYTLARREKTLMDRLLAEKIPFYCPLVEQKSRTPRGRRVTSFVPLFTSYVFLWGTEEQRRQALASNCISQTIRVDDGNRLVADLSQIHRLISSGAPIARESRLQPGARVRVKSGALMGMEGTVIRRQSGDVLIVSVSFLQQGASVAIEDFLVEPIGE